MRQLTDKEIHACLLNILKDVDEFLSKYYGDYMKLPPVHKRRSHHIIAYLKEGKEL